MADPSDGWTDAGKVEAKNATQRSLELLEHIVKCAEFARLVTNVTVCAFTPEKDGHPEEAIHALVEALTILRLRRFAWYGCGPEPQNEVLFALAENSCSCLSELVLPPELPELCMALPLLDHLQSLSFVPRYYYGDVPDIQPGSSRFNRMAVTADVNAHSLRHLCICGEVFTACSTRSTFSALVDLALLSPMDTVGLHSVFEDLSQLQSLAICMDHASEGYTMATVFQEHADALPHLKSFKLLAVWMDANDVNAVAAFLERKASLERLDFVNQIGAGPELNNEPLLRLLANFPRLTAFGCDVRTRRLTAGHLARLSACIPRRVTALVLNIAVGSSEWAATEEDWARFFEARRACRYLHIIPDCKRVPLDLRAIAARRAPPALELLGYKDTLRWMRRDGHSAPRGSGGGLLWPPERVYFRTVDDFEGHEEWEWLLRHHGEDGPLPIEAFWGSGSGSGS